MKRRVLGVLAIGGVYLSIGQTVWAEESAPENVSSVDKRSFFEKLSDKATLNYFGIYRGASLGDITNSHQPTVEGDTSGGDPQSIENLVTAGYKANQDLMIGAVAHFYYFPVGNPIGTGHALQMLDPLIRVNQANLFNLGRVRFTGRLDIQLPLTESDFLNRDGNNLALAVTPTLLASYTVPGTELSFGMFTFVRAYIPTGDSRSDVRTYRLVVAPSANLKLSKRVSATLWVDLITADRNRGSGFFSGLSNSVVDIEPGISWDITDNITFNPILNIYPANPTLASTSLQAFIVAKAF